MAGEVCEGKSRNMVSSTGFCYSSEVSSGNPSFQTQFGNQIQEFEPNPDEIFSLNSTMEVVGFSKNLHQQSGSSLALWKGVSTKSNMASSSSKTMNESSTLYGHDFNKNLIVGVGPETGAWQENRFFLDDSSLRNTGFFGKSDNMHQQHQILRDLHQYGQFQLSSSKYLIPTQQLLNEFCSLGEKLNDSAKKNSCKSLEWEEENVSTSMRKQSLQSLDFIELQKRKTMLFSMMEELERRYRHYSDQMKMVVSSFESMAGDGAGNVYSALACKAMSRHFRCLKDGIMAEIQTVKKAMGEKDQAVVASKGETPRLRILDQTLRQQRAFQQLSLMESHPWRPQRGLPERSVSILRAWLFEHFLHPYPSDVDKHILARQTGLSRSQVSNWFINARVRLWKPMVEDMYLEETKERENTIISGDGGRIRQEDQKPTADQLLRMNSDCLSSIINNNPPNNNSKSSKPMHFGSFGTTQLDFSSYNHHSAGAVSNFNGGGGGGGGVSLTLGLNQHAGNSLFYPRDSIEDCQPSVHYSLLEGETQNLPYRNLMGAQLLHDFAG